MDEHELTRARSLTVARLESGCCVHFIHGCGPSALLKVEGCVLSKDMVSCVKLCQYNKRINQTAVIRPSGWTELENKDLEVNMKGI